MQTQGPPGSDPVTNAKWPIIKDYVEHSEAFTFDENTQTYFMKSDDARFVWPDTTYNVYRGYEVYIAPVINQQELNSNQFDNQLFEVTKYWGEGDILSQHQEHKQITLTKIEFFDLWLGQKLQPAIYNENPSDPSGYTGLDALAIHLATFLSTDKSYFTSHESTAKHFSAKVQGFLTKATNIGFPIVLGILDDILNALSNFVNEIIESFLGTIQAVWSTIVNFVGTTVNFIVMVWNNVVGPVLGAAIEAVKNIVMLEIELVKIVLSTILNTPSDTVNPEEMKTFVTQQLFKQNLVQIFQGVYNFQELFEISSNPLGSLMDFIPIVQPLMQISSIGSLLSSFIQLRQLIIDLINMIGSGGLMSIIFEIVNTIITQAIQLLFDQFIAPLMNDFLSLISIDSLLSSEEFTNLDSAVEYGNFNPDFNFNNFFSKVTLLPLQIFETIKGIPIISTAFGLLINGTIDIISGVIGYIQFIISIGSSMQSSFVSSDFNLLSSKDFTDSNLKGDSKTTRSNSQSSSISIDSDLLSAFAFQLVSRILFSFATYITYDMKTNPDPNSSSDYNFNRGLLWKELALDLLGIEFSTTSYFFSDRLNTKYPDGRFAHVSNNLITMGLSFLGEMTEDFSKFMIYTTYPVDSMTIKKSIAVSSVFFAVGNVAKILGSLYYGYDTSEEKLNRKDDLSIPELFGTFATLGNTLINLISGTNSLIFGKDFIDNVAIALTKSEITNLLKLFPAETLLLDFSNYMKIIFLPIELGSISKKTYLILSGISFGLDILLYSSACFIPM